MAKAGIICDSKWKAEAAPVGNICANSCDGALTDDDQEGPSTFVVGTSFTTLGEKTLILGCAKRLA